MPGSLVDPTPNHAAIPDCSRNFFYHWLVEYMHILYHNNWRDWQFIYEYWTVTVTLSYLMQTLLNNYYKWFLYLCSWFIMLTLIELIEYYYEYSLLFRLLHSHPLLKWLPLLLSFSFEFLRRRCSKHNVWYFRSNLVFCFIRNFQLPSRYKTFVDIFTAVHIFNVFAYLWKLFWDYSQIFLNFKEFS